MDEEGRSDQELAKLLLERQAHCKQLEMELADLRRVVKMAQMHMGEWQKKCEELQKVDCKVQFRVAGKNVTLKSSLPLLDAVKTLLARPDAKECSLVPVFALSNKGEDGELVS